MFIRALLLSLCLSSSALAAPAQLSARQTVLSQAVEVERQTLVGVIEALRHGVEEEHLEMSPESIAGYHQAKVLNRQARQLHEQAKYRGAYQKLHQAYGAMRPAMVEILDHDRVPRYVLNAVGDQINESAQWISSLAAQIEHAPAEAKASYQRATEHYTLSKQLYKEREAKRAFLSWNDAMGELDRAVALTWPQVRRR